MATFIPYLMVDNAKEAIDFYAKIFDAKVTEIHYGNTVPGMENDSAAAKTVVHCTLTLPNGDTLCLAESIKTSDNKFAQFGSVITHGNTIQIAIGYTDSAEQKKIYDQLKEGAKIVMELKETFWGSLYGILEDKYKVTWHLCCDKK